MTTEYTAQIYEIDGLTTRWVAQPVNDLTAGYDLQLLKVATLGELPSAGVSLVVVGLVGTDLHIRVFDDLGATVVDKAESELTDPPARTFIKTLLQRDPFPVVAELSEEEKKSILGKATALTDYPSPYDYPIVDSISTPSYSDEANLIYADKPEFFNIASKAGYGSGLGILSESRLPEIDTVDGPFLIRSNSLVKTRTIRQFTATSNEVGQFAADLLLIVDGEMGYEYKEGTPFAFERYLDATIDLVVRVHRSDGSVETVWEAGAVMSRTEDVDLPFNAYGDWDANDWKVNGTVATLNLFEHISSRFTVTNGETFAVEFELTARTNNYENPNSEAFVRMLNTAGFRVLPSSPEVDIFGTVTFEEVKEIAQEHIRNVAVSNLAISNGIDPRIHSVYLDSRGPSIIPTAKNSLTDQSFSPGVATTIITRDLAAFFPNAPGGQIGAAVRLDHFYEPGKILESRLGSVVAEPQFFSRYIPFFNGPEQDSIDIDLRFLYHGVIEFKARSKEAYIELLNGNVFRNYARESLIVQFATRNKFINVWAYSIEWTLALIAADENSTAILDEDGYTVGQRLVYSINSDNELLGETGIRSRYESLEDLLLIDVNDYIEVYFLLGNAIIFDVSDGDKLEYFNVDFYNTFTPKLSTDTPGVSFILADSQGMWDSGTPLQVNRADADSVVLSWPSEGVGDLQKSSNLDPTTWEAVGPTVQDNGVLKTLIVPIGEDKQFFRLDPEASIDPNSTENKPIEVDR